jgi:hypothetical protein
LPTKDLEVQEDLTYIEKPTQILKTADREVPSGCAKSKWAITQKKKQFRKEKMI